MAIVPPTPRTWAVGDLETAALFNSNIRDPLAILLNPPRAQAISNASTSIPNNANTAVPFSSAPINTDGMWVSGTPGQLTVVTPGSYEIDAYLTFAGNATGTRIISIVINGSIVADIQGPATSTGRNAFTTPTYEAQSLAVGTTIAIWAYQNSGAALPLNTDSGGISAMLRAKWISN